MNNIYDILDFRFDQNEFSERGKNIVPTYVINLCQSRISSLNAITEKIGISIIDPPPTKGIREIYLKFIKIAQSNQSFNNQFDKRELRTLTYALTYKENHECSIFENSDYLEFCFLLLEENWRDSFISGLLDCYLSNWSGSNKKSFTILYKFLSRKVVNYRGELNRVLRIKKNAKYFDKEKGDLELGTTLAISNKSITEATNFLSLPDHCISYPYFSGVINGYFEESKNQLETVLDDISCVLEKHSNSVPGTKTNKIIVSKIINNTETASEIIRNKVKDIALKLVGDPGIRSIWSPFESATQSEILTINKAREILNEWITRQFINVFFEKCINDRRRKIFWLKYSNKISSFKVFGPYSVKRTLKADERVSKYVDNRFNVVPHGSASAFMFEIGNHRMIEFSIEGYAFYAFKKSNEHAPSFTSRVNSINNFTNGSMPMLVYRSGYYLHSFSDEGRLTHRDGDMNWEDVFYKWLKNKAGINV
jgi:hypothetical protein